jgi:XTP/dITP diphosphohydrolase
MREVLLATGNQGKIREIKDLLQSVQAEILTPVDLGLQLQVDEVGKSFVENAALKAKAFAEASNLLTLADDSGLEVKLLTGAPGIYSARYSPKRGANDKDRREYLIDQLQSYPKPWSARFHCTAAIATPEGEIHFAEGNCYGEIISEERGEAGFGYDPIFLVRDLSRTMAELSLVEKNQISHRSQAIKAILPTLLTYL